MSGLLIKAENPTSSTYGAAGIQRSTSNPQLRMLGLTRSGSLRPLGFTHLCRSQPCGPIREQALNSKLARQFHCSTQEAQIIVSRNFDTAKLLQVRGEPLGVKQREFLRPQMFYQRHQRDL
jgi:hypothetical protein